ncbi:hypothetical protein ACHQM5_020003 [Ranunculus cassubicifolius]
MASIISIKLVIDKEKNRVLYAESHHDFVDLLFSFLTLPIGTLTRLYHHAHSRSPEIGCMNKLYNSVSDLSASCFCTDACKKMLLHPDRASETECSRLKLNVEGRKRKELYHCGVFSKDCLLSAYSNVKCACGGVTSQSAYLEERDGGSGDGVFVKGVSAETYIVGDDLQIMAGSISACMFMLDKLGVGDDVSKIEERNVVVGLQEILHLLRRAWCSHTPLTDVFLSNHGGPGTEKIDPPGYIQYQKGTATSTTSKSFKLKLIVRKLTNKVLYAEAENDFVDQLFSFLTLPLGSAINFLGEECLSNGSIHNIYSSVTEISSKGLLKSKECEALLMFPKTAPFLSCENQVLGIEEDVPPRYNCTQKSGNGWKLFVLTEVKANSTSDLERGGMEMKSLSTTNGLVLRNPKSLLPEDKVGGGFVKDPSKFMIKDDLVVTPLSHTSCLFFLKKLNVPYNDIEERVVNLGEEEVLNLLKASLLSDTVLSTLVERKDEMYATVDQDSTVRSEGPKFEIRKSGKPLTSIDIHKILSTNCNGKR